jgi:hypothetical protein
VYCALMCWSVIESATTSSVPGGTNSSGQHFRVHSMCVSTTSQCDSVVCVVCVW